MSLRTIKFTQCEGHDTKKKAVTACKGCSKALCKSCLKTHLEIFPDCKTAYEFSPEKLDADMMQQGVDPIMRAALMDLASETKHSPEEAQQMAQIAVYAKKLFVSTDFRLMQYIFNHPDAGWIFVCPYCKEYAPLALYKQFGDHLSKNHTYINDMGVLRRQPIPGQQNEKTDLKESGTKKTHE